MLSEEIIDKLVERLVNRIEQGNAYVLEKIGKSIKAIKDISPSQIHQLNQINSTLLAQRKKLIFKIALLAL